MCTSRDNHYGEITDIFNPMREALGGFHLHSKVEEKAVSSGMRNLIIIMLLGFSVPYHRSNAKNGLLCSGEGGIVIPWGLSLSVPSVSVLKMPGFRAPQSTSTALPVERYSSAAWCLPLLRSFLMLRLWSRSGLRLFLLLCLALIMWPSVLFYDVLLLYSSLYFEVLLHGTAWHKIKWHSLLTQTKHLVSIISPLSSCEEWEITHKHRQHFKKLQTLQSKRKEEKQALR